MGTKVNTQTFIDQETRVTNPQITGDVKDSGIQLSGSNISATLSDSGAVRESFTFAGDALNRGFDLLQTTLANTQAAFTDALGISAKVATGDDVERVTRSGNQKTIRNFIVGAAIVSGLLVVLRK